MHLPADRMPVILRNEGSVDVWLNKAIPEFETVLRPYEDADLVSSSALEVQLAYPIWRWDLLFFGVTVLLLFLPAIVNILLYTNISMNIFISAFFSCKLFFLFCLLFEFSCISP